MSQHIFLNVAYRKTHPSVLSQENEWLSSLLPEFSSCKRRMPGETLWKCHIFNRRDPALFFTYSESLGKVVTENVII